ncbi:AMP-binding protein [Nonomuraea sp. M3C6]|uniref:AMP-binding protein n=1 Tax=Nonomuraea marmarensis TaxID=3351344 RepID=A0ABW7ASL1_9ACTN
MSGTDHLVCDGDAPLAAPAGIISSTWAELVAAGEREPGERREPASTLEDSWALWLYTSGTTGAPKGAMHRHANIRHVCETYADRVLGIRSDDMCLSVAKLFFAYGIGNSMFFPLSAGVATALEPRRPAPAVIAHRLAADRPTLFFAVPTFYAALLAAGLPEDTFKSVRLSASAGEALPAPLQERFTHRFGVEIIDGIGSTEALHIFLSNEPGDIRPGTTGRPVPGYDIELRDAEGARVPDGQPGALHVRGESIALGYWRRTEASRTVFAGSGSIPAGGQVSAMYPEKQIYDIAGFPTVSGRKLNANLVQQAAPYEPAYLLGEEAQRLERLPHAAQGLARRDRHQRPGHRHHGR